MTELESSLMMEKEQNMTTRRELTEAHQRVDELLMEIADANGKSTELLTTVQRSHFGLVRNIIFAMHSYNLCKSIVICDSQQPRRNIGPFSLLKLH